MAVTPLAKRYYRCGTDINGFPQYCNSSWDNWGRWVALVVVVVVAFIIFFLLAALSARRRRRRGVSPYYGTGWVGRAPFGHGQAQFTGNNQQEQQQPPYNSNAAPPYTPSQGQGYYAGQNESYYGGQQNGVELQQPQNAYQNQRGGDQVYASPTGPPPSKTGDGFVR